MPEPDLDDSIEEEEEPPEEPPPQRLVRPSYDDGLDHGSNKSGDGGSERNSSRALEYGRPPRRSLSFSDSSYFREPLF